MKTTAGKLKELGQLATNIVDAAAALDPKGDPTVFAQEMADWVRAATGLIGELAIDVAELQAALQQQEGAA